MARALALAVALLLLLAACMGGDETAGGADDLPGPVPDGVTFAEPPEEGVNAPDFTAELLDGEPLTASELWNDRPVVVLFTASWCETCRDVHREVMDVAGEHEGVAILGVVGDDDAEGAREYAEELDVNHPVAVAGDDVWLDWAAREPPLVALVAPGGKVLRGWPGNFDAGALGEALDGLYQGAPPQAG